MAEGVGVFSRLRNLWRGFLGLWIEGLESEHPEAVYEAAIEGHKKKYAELKKAVSGLVYLRNKLQTDLEKKSAELAEIELQIPVAVEADEDEVALVLLERKETLSSEIGGLQAELQQAQGQAEEAKSSLIEFQSEIAKLKQEKDTMLAKRANAEARIKIQEGLDGLSADADLKALEGVRESIHKMAAEADVTREVSGENLDAKLKKIKAKTASVSARAKLDAMKKARAAQAQGPVSEAAVQQAQAKKTL